MSKELEALENIKHYDTRVGLHIDDYSIIESALKEKETQDNVIKTLKEIIEFSQMLPHIEPNKDNGFNIMSAVSINIQRDIENKERELLRKWVLETCFPKELKALEIIKEKTLTINDLYWLKNGNYREYRKNLEILYFGVEKEHLQKVLKTQEEYDLLKEVLNNGKVIQFRKN